MQISSITNSIESTLDGPGHSLAWESETEHIRIQLSLVFYNFRKSDLAKSFKTSNNGRIDHIANRYLRF